uniref:Uncharacterized protein n=1 Tax=Heterorhabditis bacteriophora TaxID=37862 RepID=A0A1I7WJD8_HETBA
MTRPYIQGIASEACGTLQKPLKLPPLPHKGRWELSAEEKTSARESPEKSRS